MTVTISSTTDTDVEIQEAAGISPKETPHVEEGRAPAPEISAVEATSVEEETPVEAVSEETSPDESEQERATTGDEETALDVEAAGEVATESDEVEEPDAVEAKPEEEEENASEEEAPEVPAKKKRRRRGRSYKDRASQLAREKAAEAARANALAHELDALKRGATQPQPPQRPDFTAPTPAGEPQEAKRPEQGNFENYEEYQEALVDWKVSQRLDTHEKERAERVEQQRQTDSQRQVVAAHEARIDAFRTENPDFDATVVEANGNLPITQPMVDTIYNSEHGPALMYHLCQNPEECDRIAQMHPLAAIKEMGRLEMQLEVATHPGPTHVAEPVTKAPRPIKPVGGGATASTVPLDQMSYQDFKRAREKHLDTQNHR